MKDLLDRIIGNPYTVLIARLIVGLMFIVVGLSKIADPQLFAKEIGNYRMLPELFVNLVAIFLPWLELVCGLLLIAGVRLRANAVLISIMLLVFIVGVGSAWARGLNINCGCYSNIAKQTVGLPKILENIGLIALTMIIYFFPKRELTLEEFIKKTD